jgi:hypothetical protein
MAADPANLPKPAELKVCQVADLFLDYSEKHHAADTYRGYKDFLQEAAERQHNVIVRPRFTGATLIQLDDLDEDMASRLLPVSFLVLRTSPSPPNYQIWVAVVDGDADFAERLRKGTGADLTASGATRVSGSLNVKAKYAPDFPRVETVKVGLGRVVTRAELKALGLVAPPEKTVSTAIHFARRRPDTRGWRATTAT